MTNGMEIAAAIDVVLRLAGAHLGGAQSDTSEFVAPFELVERVRDAARAGGHEDTTKILRAAKGVVEQVVVIDGNAYDHADRSRLPSRLGRRLVALKEAMELNRGEAL